MMRQVFDTRVDAAGVSHPADVDDWVACIGAFHQGASACLESTKVASGRGDGATGHDLCEINGTEASASYRLGDPHGVQLGRKGGRFERVAVPESFLVEPGSPRDPRAGDPLMAFRYDQTWRFLQSILDGAPVGPSFRAGLDVQIVMDAIVRSAATGETVTIDSE
jgi:predicted dehydrogenase